MEEGTKSKKTIFVGGVDEDVNEAVLMETFATFGDIIEVQLPVAAANPTQQTESKHRGFAFVTFTSAGDAQDAIDNMDLNELRGKVIKVSLARPGKGALSQPAGNRAVWESEEWLKQYAKPLSESGGLHGRKSDTATPEQATPEQRGENEGEEDAMEE